jgi:hypothetical protein
MDHDDSVTSPEVVIDLTDDDREYFASSFHDVPRRRAVSRTERELSAIYA